VLNNNSHSETVKNQIHNNPSHRPLSLRPLWCPCGSAVRVCVQDSESVCHPQSHTLTVKQRQRWLTIQPFVSYCTYSTHINTASAPFSLYEDSLDGDTS